MKNVYESYLEAYDRIISLLEGEIYPRVRDVIHLYSDKGFSKFDSERVWKKIREEAKNLIYWGGVIRDRVLEDLVNVIKGRYDIVSMRQLEGKWMVGEYRDEEVIVYDTYKRIDGSLDLIKYKENFSNKAKVVNPYIITVRYANKQGEEKRYEMIITSRIKSIKSMLQKLKLSTFTDKELGDVIGLRIIVRGEGDPQEEKEEIISVMRELAKDVLYNYIANEQRGGNEILIVPYLIKGIPVRMRYKEHIRGKLYSQRVRIDDMSMVIYYVSYDALCGYNNGKSDPFINIVKNNTYVDGEGEEKKRFKKVVLRDRNRIIRAYKLNDGYLRRIGYKGNTESLWFIPMNYKYVLDKNKKNKRYYLIVRTTSKSEREEERIAALINYLEKRRMVENYGQMSRSRQLPHPVLMPVDRPFKDGANMMIIRSNPNLYEDVNSLMSEVMGITNYGPEEPQVFMKDRYKREIKAEGTGSKYKAIHLSFSIKSDEHRVPGVELQLSDIHSYVNNEVGSASHKRYKSSKGNLIVKILKDIMRYVGVSEGRQGNILKEIKYILDL